MQASNDEKFQELIRVVDATTATYNSEALITGYNTLDFIKLEYSKTGLKDFISPHFYQLIGEELTASKEKANVREHIKRILMYPHSTYLPWKIELKQTELPQEIINVMNSVYFQMQVVEGKVYAKCLSEVSLAEVIFDICRPEGLRANTETSHISVVTSNIVADIGIETVERFLESYKDTFTVQPGAIKSTTSLDWSRFGKCQVLEIYSEFYEYFLKQFNSAFNRNIKPSPHITFAIAPRSLFESK